MLLYVPQELFHRQSLCQTATERPLWPDLQHAVLQLCHEERCGTLDLCWTSSVSRRWTPDSDLFPPPPLPVWLHQTRIGLSLYDVAGQGYLRELVSAVLFFFSQESFMLRLQVDSCGLTAGSGELHPGVDPHSASAGRPGEVLLLLLRLHCCSQVLFLPGPASNRWVRTSEPNVDRETRFQSQRVLFPFLFSGKIKIQDILACSFLDDLLEVHILFFCHFCHENISLLHSTLYS